MDNFAYKERQSDLVDIGHSGQSRDRNLNNCNASDNLAPNDQLDICDCTHRPSNQNYSYRPPFLKIDDQTILIHY